MARRTTSPSSRSRSKAKTIDTPVLVEVPSAAAPKPETFDPYWQQLEHESNTTAHSNLDQIPTADDRSTDEPDAEPQLSPIEGSDRPVNRSGSADSNGKGLSQKSKRQARSKKPAFKVGDRVYSVTDDQQDLVIHAIKDGIATCKPPYRTQIAVGLENLRPWKLPLTVEDWFRIGEGKSLHYVAQVDHEQSLIYWRLHPGSNTWYRLHWTAETSLHRASAPDWADLHEGDRVAWIRPDRLARLGVIQKTNFDALTAVMQWDEPLADANIADLTQLHLWNHEWKIGDRIVQDGNKPEWADKDRMSALISHGTILDIRFYCGYLTPWVKWETGVEAGTESWGIVSEFHPWDEATEEPEPLPPDEPPMTAEQVIEEMDRAMQAAQSPESKDSEWLFNKGDRIREKSSSRTGTITGRASAGANYVQWDDGTGGVTSKGIAELLELPFKVGDRVRVIKGAAKGLVSYITAIEPDLKHSCTLHVGGRQRPDCLEKLDAEPQPPFKVGDRVEMIAPYGINKSYIGKRGRIKRLIRSGGYAVTLDDNNSIILGDEHLKRIDEPLNLQVLNDQGFVEISADEYDGDNFVEIYKGISISLCIPNGGIVAVDLWVGDKYYSRSTEHEFDYHDQDGIVVYARSVIDQLWGEPSVTLTVPPSPQVEVEAGDTIHTASGAATVTRTETAGNETIVHADYGSGIEQPHVSEGIQSTPQLADLAAQFNQLEQDADQARQTQLNAGRAHWEARRDQGAILLQAKSQVAHGGWQQWVEEHCKAADGKPLSIRMAQIYMQVATHWDEIAKNEMHFAFGLEAGLKQLRKALKPQRQLTLDVGATGATTEQSDAPIPPLEELKRLYEPIGTVKAWGDGFCVERPDLGNPFPLAFKTPALAWVYWQKFNSKLLELAKRKPKIETQPEAPKPLEPPPQKEQVPLEQITQVNPYSGWIQTKDGQNLNPGYYEPASAPAQPEPAAEADLDTLFESAMAEALEPVQEWLGEKAMQKHLNATQTAIGQLGALPVALRAAYESDHDDLLRLREFIDLMLEMN